MMRRQFVAALAGAAGVAPSVPADQDPRVIRSSGSITDVPGPKVGHFTDERRPTGCTALLFEGPAAAGVDYDGSAPGETQVVMLQPISPVDSIHAILRSGGGVFGLGAVAGAVRFLEERKIGYDWGAGSVRIPIVVGAIIDDLAVGDGRLRPDPESAYKACAAVSAAPPAEGNVGAGAGATVGRMLQGQGMRGEGRAGHRRPPPRRRHHRRARRRERRRRHRRLAHGEDRGRSAPRRWRRVRRHGGHPEEKPGSREAARTRGHRRPRAAQHDAGRRRDQRRVLEAPATSARTPGPAAP